MGNKIVTEADRKATKPLPGATRIKQGAGQKRSQERGSHIHTKSPATDTELRLAAITTAAQLADDAAIELLAHQLLSDLSNYPRLALAETAALVKLGHPERATEEIRRALEAEPRTPNVSALAAHALAPIPALDGKLAGWFARGDARTRAGVCAAIPRGAPRLALVERGLRDADATVRATCADAAARQGREHLSPATLARLRELDRDRDHVVRARGVAALAVVDPQHVVRAASDPAPEVRAAAAARASETELRTLAADPDPDVRAAALVALGERAPELSVRAATDVASQVRRAAVQRLVDEEALTRLSHDDAPEVAQAALVRLAALRGRAVITAPLLDELASAPAGSAERVRIALAWLLAAPR